MKAYRHIVVGIDFSPACLSAFRAAARLASLHGTPVTAIHAVDPKLMSIIQKSHEISGSAFLASAFDHVHAFIAKANAPTSGITVELEVGHPVLTLLGACARHQADLLALGTRGTEHGPNQVGAVAAKCVRRAPADVLLVREGASEAFRRITVCVDFSETSAKAVRSAALMAKAEDATLDCLFVFQPVSAMSMDYSGFMPALPMSVIETPQSLRKDMDEFLRPILCETDQPWISHVLERINIRDGIFEHVRDHRTDLVVVGTQGKTNLRTLLMGTTAERVLTHAPCSVLAVKPDGFGALVASTSRNPTLEIESS